MTDDELTAKAAREAERAAIVAFMRDAIGSGYPASPDASQRAQCPHDKFYYEDCIACYDEFLISKLEAIEQATHLRTQSI